MACPLWRVGLERRVFLCVRRWNARAFGRTRAMSEYQYYEFAATRPLTSEQMSRLRALSTRATITPTRFCNVYTWGDFKGDPLALMEEYFDAFVYVTNWGTHELMLHLPRRLLSRTVADAYRMAESMRAKYKGDHIIITFSSEDEHAA